DTLTELPVVSVTASEAVATLPAAIAPGTYLLIAYQPTTAKFATFEVTIGAVGPEGPTGQAGRDGQIQSLVAGDASIAVANGTGPNPTVTVAANGINNAKVADGSLSPGKIAGTAATVGSNIFNGMQVVNGALGIGAAPAFNLHVVG